jgi:hypothetical protein
MLRYVPSALPVQVICMQLLLVGGALMITWCPARAKQAANTILNRSLRSHLQSLIPDGDYEVWRRQFAAIFLSSYKLHQYLCVKAIQECVGIVDGACRTPGDHECSSGEH